MHTRFKSLIIPALAVICFTVLSCLWLDRLGLAVDEATHGFWAQRTLLNIKSLLGCSAPAFETISKEFSPEFFLLPVGSTVLPLMTCFFTGTFIIYWLVPVVLFFGQSIFALRLAFVPFGIIFLISVYYVVRRFFGALVANITIVLLAFNSVLIRSMRVGAEREEIVVNALCWSGFALFLSSDSGKRPLVKIALAGILWGIAFWAKISFFAYAYGIVSAIVFLRKFVWRDLCCGFLRVRNVFVLLGGFICGALPLIIYNAMTRCEAVFSSITCLRSAGSGDGPSYLGALFLRFGHILRLLSGDLATCFIDSGRVSVGTWAAGLSFIIVFVYLCFLRDDKRFSRVLILGLMQVYLMLFSFAAITPSAFEPEHMTAFFPFFEIITALAVAVLVGLKGRFMKFSALALACSIGIVPCVQHALVTAKYFSALKSGKSSFQYFSGQHKIREIIRREKLFPLVFFDSYTIGMNIEYGLLEGLEKDDFNPYIKSFYLLVENTGQKTPGLELLELMEHDPNIECRKLYFEQSDSRDYELAVYVITPVGKANYDWIYMLDGRFPLHWAPPMLSDLRTSLFHVCRLLGFSAFEDERGRVVFTPVSL